MTDIKQCIMQKLKDTETQYHVRIPLAIESGSRGWGFASPDSDCRFIYVHERDWYISVFEKKDIIEYQADKVFDINGWDIRKVLKHIIKSNAVIFEWLSSNEVYIKDWRVASILNELATRFFNPVAVSYHYLSIAQNKLNEIVSDSEVRLKKYFYILRPIANLNFIYQHGKMPYMEYDKTIAEIDINKAVYDEIQTISRIKQASNESFIIKNNDILIDYFNEEIELFKDRINEYKVEKNKDYEEVDTVFKSIIEMMW